jgi:dienelactone hydrolase
MKKCILLLAFCWVTNGEIVTRTIEYTQDTTVLKGILVYDEALKGRHPGVLVFHEFYGINDFIREQASRLAKMGYVAFAADMYGNGRSTADRSTAGAWAGAVRGTPLMRLRGRAAFDALRKEPLVDTTRIAALGFCFGGTASLELALSGSPLRAAISFHGGLPAPDSADIKKLKASILVLHGADDPSVKPADITAFMDGMRRAHADWQMIFFGNAVHAFTNPKSGNDPSRGAAYNKKAATRSWNSMEMFLKEMFR